MKEWLVTFYCKKYKLYNMRTYQGIHIYAYWKLKRVHIYNGFMLIPVRLFREDLQVQLSLLREEIRQAIFIRIKKHNKLKSK